VAAFFGPTPGIRSSASTLAGTRQAIADLELGGIGDRARLACGGASGGAGVASGTGVDRIDASAREHPGPAVEGELRVAPQEQHLELGTSIAQQNNRGRGRCLHHEPHDTLRAR
jgi:hypothetical protein